MAIEQYFLGAMIFLISNAPLNEGARMSNPLDESRSNPAPAATEHGIDLNRTIGENSSYFDPPILVAPRNAAVLEGACKTLPKFAISESLFDTDGLAKMVDAGKINATVDNFVLALRDACREGIVDTDLFADGDYVFLAPMLFLERPGIHEAEVEHLFAEREFYLEADFRAGDDFQAPDPETLKQGLVHYMDGVAAGG
jgi:hypothetical protein